MRDRSPEIVRLYANDVLGIHAAGVRWPVAIARGRLPASVAGRRSKGEASARFSRAVCSNLGLLREDLLGGALAEALIVDADHLARILDPQHMFYSLDYRTIAVLVTCEAWLRAWRR